MDNLNNIIINGKSVDNNLNMSIYLKNLYGFNKKLIILLIKRFEMFAEKIKNFNNSLKYLFYKILIEIIPLKFSLKERYIVIILYTSLLNTYKSWRFIKGLPSKGQRTWTNRRSSKIIKNIIKSHKISFLKNVYTNFKDNDIYNIFLAEQINYLWIRNWFSNWFDSYKKKYNYLSKKYVIYKIDIFAMSKNIVNEPQHRQGKKKVSVIRKGYFNLGFPIYFTSRIINAINADLSVFNFNIVSNKRKKSDKFKLNEFKRLRLLAKKQKKIQILNNKNEKNKEYVII